MEKVSYLDLPDCCRIKNETVELIASTNVGPRILRYGFIEAENILGEAPDAVIQTSLGKWKPWGGHRLWTAPEAMPRSYAPDSSSVEIEISGENSILLTPALENETGLQKQMHIAVANDGTNVCITHRLMNHGLWTIDVALWAITMMNGKNGGEVILPQEPYRSWNEALLPARPMVLWHYTDLSDPRWKFEQKYIRLRSDAAFPAPQKIGVANKQGWSAFHHDQTLFVKSVAYQSGENYADYGCNNETYTAGETIELETLSPLYRLEPGATIEHIENWWLFREVTTSDEERLATVINSLLLN